MVDSLFPRMDSEPGPFLCLSICESGFVEGRL